MPIGIDAPRGGRAMSIRSVDGGRNWTKPETLIDTPWDYRHPNFVELSDGTILCTFFTTPGNGNIFKNPAVARHTGIIRSTDGGRTWEQNVRRLCSPFASDATDGPPIVLHDGSVLLVIYGRITEKPNRNELVYFDRAPAAKRGNCCPSSERTMSYVNRVLFS